MLFSPAVTITPNGPSTYDLTAPVSVQVACYNTSRAEFATQAAHYELRVTPDPDGTLRKAFIDEIYQYWHEQPKSYLDDYQYLPADKSILEKRGRYVLYVRPDNERPGATYRFYANDHVFELELKSVEGDGWGPLSSLIAEHIAFREQGETFDRIYFEPKYPPAKLMALYEAGTLR